MNEAVGLEIFVIGLFIGAVLMGFVTAYLYRDLPMGIRKSVLWFAGRMERKLRRDDEAKGDWKNLPVAYLYRRLVEESEELRCAITAGEPMEAIIDECADVGNMAHFIACKNNGEMMKLKRGR